MLGRSLAPLALVVAAVVALGPAAGATSEAETLDLSIDSVNADEHPTVRVAVGLPPEMHGAEVDAEAFTVTEDDQERPVTVESAETEPFEVMLAIDTSGSMEGEPLASAQAAATAFVDEMPAGTRIGVLQFASLTDVLIAPTDDHAAVVDAIGELESQGYTALYDGVVDSLDALGDGRRQTVIVLSDGGDNPSPEIDVEPTELDETLDALEVSSATLHTFELVTEDSDPEALAELAETGEGTATSVADPEALADVYSALASQLVNTYEVSYTSDVVGSTRITVAVDDGDRVATGRWVGSFTGVAEPEPAEPEGILGLPDWGFLSPGLLTSQWALVAGAVLFYLALFTLVLTIFAPSERRTQLAGAGGSGWSWRRPQLSNLAERATLLAERGLQGHGRARRLNTALERAGIALRPGEFVVLAVSAATVAFAIAFVFINWIVAVLLALAAYPIARAILKVLADRRRERFAEQLDDTLQLLAGSLRAGYGLTQAIDTVSRESPSPTAEEFKRIVVEMRLGRNASEALEAAAHRIDSDDFWWVVRAMEIHREIGGDLAEVLDNVGQTIRERNHVRGQVKALSAEGRLSGVVLVALPFVVAGAVYFLNPGYIEELFSNIFGIIMVIVAAVLMVIGTIWIRRVVKMVY